MNLNDAEIKLLLGLIGIFLLIIVIIMFQIHSQLNDVNTNLQNIYDAHPIGR